MSAATANPPKVWTTEDLLAMPDDGVERWIIRGQLREQPSEFPEAKMTVRNRHHCSVMSQIAASLAIWLRSQAKPRGEIYCGEVGVIFPGRDSTVGIDVAYAGLEVVEVQDDDESTVLQGVPTLTVEILSPSDTHEAIEEKIDEYLDVGVPLVWTVNTHRQTVTVHQPGAEPRLFSISDRMPEHPSMPGFAPAVAEFFE